MKVNFAFSILFLASCLCVSCGSDSKDAVNTGNGQSTDSSIVARIPSPAVPVPSDSLIVPGRFIGDVELDTDAAGIMRKYSRPDAGDAAMGKAVSTWFEGHDTAGYARSIFTSKDVGNSETALIKQVRVTAPNYKTEQGIGTSVSLSQLKKNFNLEQQKGYKLNNKEVDVYADSAGIAFEIDKQGRCIGIVVYPAGALHPDTYARFLPGIKTK
jgi:hypothetical protein